MQSCLKILLWASLCAPLLCAEQQPQFEVATVKRDPAVAPGTPLPVNLGSFRGGTAMLTNATLSECLEFAYGIVSDTQIDGPDWIKSRDVRFDIVGKTGPDVPREQAVLMMRSLLTERLKLTMHHEPREMSFLALVVAKNGPKLKPANMQVPGEQIPPQLPGRLSTPRMLMSVLATLLSRFERQIVMDETGLNGFFSVDLQWTPDALHGATPIVNGQPVNSDGPSLPTALQEQLGLRLESRKGPVDVLVVDSAEKVPTDN
jgi:uncharacterized protein (TIGR03435 family)